MTDEQIKESLRTAELMGGYLYNRLTNEEEDELFSWVNQDEEHVNLFIKLINEHNLTRSKAELGDFDTAAALAKVKMKMSPAVVKKLNVRKWLLPAAATILLSLSIATYVYLQRPDAVEVVKADVAPGGNKAILTLADGKQIVLNDAQNGIVAYQANSTISKTADGQIVYNATTGDQIDDGGPMAYNTITTPKGGQYQIVLPDGTKAWLNAASSLRYPTSFKGTERKVELSGEGYFEVVHNSLKPFRVIAGDETIEDIGTSFNINAYTDEEALKTTLISGRAVVHKGEHQIFLNPGQQSVGTPLNPILQVRTADTDEVLSWKNGFFYFRQADIKTIMRTLSRWYDVDVRYEGSVPNRRFTGEMHRDVPISQVFGILEFLKIDFRIEGKTIIVTNKH